jgi:serine/threonine protein kinase
MFDDEHVPLMERSFTDIRRLDHPNIVRYKALYLDLEKHLAYLVMEYINLPSLIKYIAQLPQPISENVQIL